jgi:hypothetical protein
MSGDANPRTAWSKEINGFNSTGFGAYEAGGRSRPGRGDADRNPARRRHGLVTKMEKRDLVIDAILEVVRQVR